MKMRIVAVAALCALTLGPVSHAAEAPAPTEGSAVEVREGNVWSRATFLRKEGRKSQVRYDDGTDDWVTSDRIRPLSSGSGTGAAARADEPAAQAVSLDGPFIEVRMDNAAPPRVAIGSPLRLKPTTRPAPAAAPFVKLAPSAPTPIQPIHDLFVCPDTPQVVVGITEGWRGEGGQVLVLDLTKPDKFDVRSIEAPNHEILGAASGGRLLLSTPRAGASVTLHLWEYDGQDYRLKANYTLISEKGGKRINWASLQNENRAVVGCDGGECYLVDLKARRAISFFPGNHAGKRSLLSDGSALSVREGDTAGLVRANDFAVIAKFSDAQFTGGVDPTGAYAAYAVSGRGIRVVRTTTGASVGTIAGALTGDGASIDLLSGDAVMVGNRMVYGTKTGMPLWEYNFQDLRRSLLLPSGQMLLAFADGATTTLCLATLPDPSANAMIKAAKPGDFLLAPGAEIGLSGDLARIYGSDAQAAMAALQKVVGSAGHKLVSGKSRLMLAFKAAPGKTGEFTYRENPRPGVPMMGPPPMRKVPAPSTDVTVTLTCDGQPIWEQSFHFAAGFIVLSQGGKTIEQAVAEEGRPKAASLNSLAIPSYVAPGSTLTNPTALRKSTVTPEGFGPATVPTPDPVVPGQKVPTGAEDEV